MIVAVKNIHKQQVRFEKVQCCDMLCASDHFLMATGFAECACVIRSRCSSNEFCWDSSRKGFARPVQHQRFGEIEAILAIALLLIASDIFQLAY